VKLPFDLQALWARVLAWYNGYSERDRRVILGVVIAGAASFVYLGIVEPVLDYRKGVQQEISDGQEELERSMRFLSAKETLKTERDDLKRRLTQAKARLLPGGTATLGAAALQERANGLAAEKGITVQSTQVMKEETLEPFRKVAVRLTLSGELKPLADFVSGLEFGQQLVVPFIEVSRRGAVVGAKGPRTLSITVEVNGFVQGGKGDASAKPDAGDGEAVPVQEAAVDGGTPADDGAGTSSSTLAEATPTTLPATGTATTVPSTVAPVEPTVAPSTATTATAPTTSLSFPLPANATDSPPFTLPSITLPNLPAMTVPSVPPLPDAGQPQGDGDDDGGDQ
jgi:type II secretory pathway component PulM